MQAERIRWRESSRLMKQASRSMDERLRRMNAQASALDVRLRRAAEERVAWHAKWDDPSRT